MRRVRQATAGLLIGTALVALMAPAAEADDGYAGPDPTYAGDGALELSASGARMAVDGEDRLVTLVATGAPGSRLERHLPSGDADPAFTPLDLPQIWANRSTLSVLDDGSISIIQRRDDTVPYLVVRATASGALDPGYGTDGVLTLDGVQAGEPFLAPSDGTVVTAQRYWGFLRFRRYDATGHLDPGFGDGGQADVACCGAVPEVPQALSIQPDRTTGGLVALIRHRQEQAIIRLAPDGTPGAELPIPVPAWASSLWAVPVGGFYLATQAGPDDSSGAGSVHLDGDLAPDSGGGSVPWVPSPADVHVVGDRVLVTRSLGSGRAAITAYRSTGLDPTYGTNGSVVTEAMTPLEPDQSGGPTTAVVAVAPDGRALVAASWTWYPGFFNPYYQYASRIEAYDATGQRLHRWDSRGTPEAMTFAGAEQSGRGFLLQSTLSNVPMVFTPPWSITRVRRWIPPRRDAVLGPVRSMAVSVTGDKALISWQPPAPAPGLLITGYQVQHAIAGGPATAKDLTSTSTLVTLPSAPPLTPYRIEVRARGIDGALGPAATQVVIPGLPLDAFFDHLDAGFGSGATPAERAEATRLLGDGTATPAFLVRAIARTEPWRSSVDPVVRLYQAYFHRPPDPGGLRYWAAKRRAGTSVARISAVFADSSEFRRTYGSLSNREFVELVYANVLGRAGDPGGLAYWTGRLDRRTTSRGHLMASFSESSEHVRRTQAVVDAVSIFWGLLGRTPTSAELATWAGPSPAGDAEAMVTALLQTDELRALLEAGGGGGS